jgi:serpin B
MQIAAKAQQTFGLRLALTVVEQSPGKNVFLSPLSVFFALAMTEAGAANSTLAAMKKTLALPDVDVGTWFTAVGNLRELLAADVSIANALWADHQQPLAPSFIRICQNVFGAEATSLNFEDPHATAQINAWVNEKTEGKIPTIVTQDLVTQAAVILTNAVYFAGRWDQQFSKSATQGEDFHKSDGSTKTVAMMRRSHLKLAYRKGANYEAVALGYRGSEVGFYALLPASGQAPKDVLGSLDVAALLRSVQEFDVDLKLPRFNLDYSAGLAEYLRKMGMDVAFRFPGADFTPMGSKLFYISEVVHKTRLEVDEDGTVAAAATAVVMAAGSAMARPREKKTLIFNRPFVVLMANLRTGAILFAGAVEQP